MTRNGVPMLTLNQKLWNVNPPTNSFTSLTWYNVASQSLSPALQVQQARNNVKQMKHRATVDHFWEPMGHWPECIND